MELIDRPAYVAWLEKWRDHDVVKVLTGVRRSGKSTILELFRSRLLSTGVAPDQIVSVNLEDPDQEREYAAGLRLYAHVMGRRRDDRTTYVFLDEAQHLAQFERTVGGLGLLRGVDVYITGSNSDFLSGDLASRLTGRFVELHVLPFSYRELAGVMSPTPAGPGRAPYDPWPAYLRFGGFPYVARLSQDETMVRQYLTSVVSTIVMKDIAPRQASFSPTLFGSVLEFMMDNVGNLANTKRISDTLTSMGRKTGRTAVEHYVGGLADSYLLYRAPRYDVRGRVYLENSAKYYAVDPGVRWALLGSRHPDSGRVLENVVYLELLRRGHRVSVGQVGRQEVDFIAEADGTQSYYQVTERVDTPEAVERELAPLRTIPDNYPRWLLVGTDGPAVSWAGIRQVSVRDWLLGTE